MNNITAINNKFEALNNLGDYGEAGFNVYTKPLTYASEPEGAPMFVPNKKVLVRDDTNESVGIVGKNYGVAQHPDAFRTVERIIANSDLNTDGVKRDIQVSHDGARAYAVYTLPAHSIGEGKEETALQISTRNSFDGSWCFHVEVGAVRMICLNGQVFLDSFAMFKARHTAGLNMDHASRKLSQAITVYKNETERWKAWQNTSVTDSEAFKILADVAGCKFVTKTKALTSSINSLLIEPEVYRNKTLISLWKQYTTEERKALGSTAWAVYNTMTHWATHASATKSTAQKNIAAIQVARQDKIRVAARNSLVLAA
jgi:hypothetical protein|tara:strand:- start:103 stop:1044 length:942 start_codon:yes stop_codon:yes gene_type:complete